VVDVVTLGSRSARRIRWATGKYDARDFYLNVFHEQTPTGDFAGVRFTFGSTHLWDVYQEDAGDRD